MALAQLKLRQLKIRQTFEEKEQELKRSKQLTEAEMEITRAAVSLEIYQGAEEEKNCESRAIVANWLIKKTRNSRWSKSSAPADLDRDAINPTTSSYNPTTSSYNVRTSSYNPTTSSYNPTMSSCRPPTSSYNPTVRSQNCTEVLYNLRPATTSHSFPYSTTFHPYSTPRQPPMVYEPAQQLIVEKWYKC